MHCTHYWQQQFNTKFIITVKNHEYLWMKILSEQLKLKKKINVMNCYNGLRPENDAIMWCDERE